VDGFVAQEVPVLGTSMHVVAAGTGPPVVFLHGNPTSSYLWRTVLAAADLGPRRAIAVDLIGMGRSGKPPIAYTLRQQVDHVEAVLDVLAGGEIVLVGHDWGAAIALEWLRRHPGRAAGVAFMEGHLRPRPDWTGIDDVFRRLRTPEVGERLALEENFLLEVLLPAATRLRPADLAVYRRPYPTPASRRPLLAWTRQIPIAGEPPETVADMAAAWTAFAASPAPKLLIHGGPGVVVTPDEVARCRAELPNLTVTDVGPAGHFLPEDRPIEVAAALSAWLRRAVRQS
jgi:haloalkane dehalogenase